MLKGFTKAQIALVSTLGVIIIVLAAILVFIPRNSLVGGSETLSTAEYKKLSAHLKNLLDTENPEVALDYLTELMATDHKVDNTCHPLVHEIGHISYMKYKNFSEAWTIRMMSVVQDTCMEL